MKISEGTDRKEAAKLRTSLEVLSRVDSSVKQGGKDSSTPCPSLLVMIWSWLPVTVCSVRALVQP